MRTFFRIYQLTLLEISQSEKKVIHKKSALGNTCLRPLCSNAVFVSYSSIALGTIVVHSKSSRQFNNFPAVTV